MSKFGRIARLVTLLAPAFALAFFAHSGFAHSAPLQIQKQAQEQHNEVAPHPQVRRSAPKPLSLDVIFKGLKLAPDAESAKYVEGIILSRWHVSMSDTTELLMGRARAARDAKDQDLALKLYTAVIDTNPDPAFFEAWSDRAEIYMGKRDYGDALADIHYLLKKEPRHFQALAMLGKILLDVGDEKGALTAFRRVLDIYPHMAGVAEAASHLVKGVEGQHI